MTPRDPGPPHDPVAPTASLQDDHTVILRALSLLEGLGAALEAGTRIDRTALAWLIDFFATFVDRCHHAKEEQHLFPALERHGLPAEGGPTGAMRYEHEVGRSLLRAMAEGGDGEIADAIARYAAFLRIHIDKENGVLFPLADQLLPPDEQGALARAFGAVEQSIVGPTFREGLLRNLTRLEAGGFR
jgi:hemerythrin-like domain-containing protein